MSTTTEGTAAARPTRGESAEVTLVDPRAPRFGQTLTTLGLGGAIVLDFPLLLYATTVVLVAAVVSGWRLDLYATLWRRVLIPVVGKPLEREPAAPHRFARVMGAIGATLASALVLAGVPMAGYLVAGAVALLAGFAATTGICIGCKVYRQVAFFRRLNVV